MPLPTLIPIRWGLEYNGSTITLTPTEHKIYTFLHTYPGSTAIDIARAAKCTRQFALTAMNNFNGKLAIIGLHITRRGEARKNLPQSVTYSITTMRPRDD